MFEKITMVSVRTFTGCNMNCYYCHETLDSKNNGKSFNKFNDLEKFILSLPIGDKLHLALTGGEVTLSENTVLEMFNMCKRIEQQIDVRIYPKITTNGTKIGKLLEWFDKGYLNDYNCAFSWDGLYSASKSRKIKVFNDEYFQNAIKIIGRNNHNRITVTFAITPDTIDDLYDSLKYCYDNNVLNFNYYFIHEGNYDNEELLKKFTEQLEKVARFIVDVFNNGKIIYLHNWKLLMNKQKSNYPFYLCAKLGQSYHVDVDGTIYPCVYFGDHQAFPIGDICKGLDETKVNDFCNQYLTYPKCPFKTCNCYQCSECMASNYVHNGNMSCRFQNACKYHQIENQIFDEYSQKIESILFEKLYKTMNEDYMSNAFLNIEEYNYTNNSKTNGILSPNYDNVRNWV